MSPTGAGCSSVSRADSSHQLQPPAAISRTASRHHANSLHFGCLSCLSARVNLQACVWRLLMTLVEQ